MFPICNDNGEVIAFSGRVLDADAKAAKYMNSPETPIFNKSRVFFGFHKAKRAVAKASQAIVCEGQIDLVMAFEAGFENVVAALGTERIGASKREVVLRDAPGALEELEDLPIRGRGNRIFRLGELAQVRPEEDSRGFFYRVNGRTAVGFIVTREPTADAIETAKAVKATLHALGPQLPGGVRWRITGDDSKELDRQLKDLMLRGLIAFAAVTVVLIISLRNWRAVALVMGSAAVAIAGTALGLYLLEIPANMLTLAGLGMGVGVLVQNGLVIVERLRSAPDTDR